MKEYPMAIAALPLMSILLLFSLLTACEPDEVLPELSGLQALQASYTEMKPTDPCTGSLRYQVGYSIVPTALLSGYNFAVQIQPTSPPLGNSSCTCLHQQYCVTVQFPQSSISLTAISDPSNAIIYALEPYEEGGYVGHNSVQFRSPLPHYGFQLGGVVEHTVCVTSGSTVYFRFPYGLPPGFDPQTAVVRATGLCIVDNLPDPHG
ncbi:MAG: hypothetical protein AAGN35_23315 [Bacteroidota bacterium]